MRGLECALPQLNPSIPVKTLLLSTCLAGGAAFLSGSSQTAMMIWTFFGVLVVVGFVLARAEKREEYDPEPRLVRSTETNRELQSESDVHDFSRSLAEARLYGRSRRR